MHGSNRLEFSRITPYIYLGTNMCCQVHFDARLAKKGIEADISLEYDSIDTPRGVKYFLWLPVKDHTAPSIETLKIGSAALTELMKNKVKTYVHCKQGHGRSPTLIAAYFILQGKNWESSVNYIKRKRPSIHLTKSQVSILRKFEKIIKNNDSES